MMFSVRVRLSLLMQWRKQAVAAAVFVCSIGTAPVHAQNLTSPQTRAFGTEYTASASGFLVVNARTGSCSNPIDGHPQQRIQIRVGGKVVAEEQDFDPQRSLSITLPVVAGSTYQADVLCSNAFTSAFFIAATSSAPLFGSPEPFPLNTSLTLAQSGFVVANASIGTCRSPKSNSLIQAVSIQGPSFSSGRFLEEVDTGSERKLVLTAPLLAQESLMVERYCNDEAPTASFYPIITENAGVDAPTAVPLAARFIPSTDGLLTISAKPGNCISNDQLIQRVATIVDGVTIADEQAYGAERSLSVTVPIRKGAIVIAEAACPLASASASFFPLRLSASGVVPACTDGKDNDGDGLVDLLDPGCQNRVDTNEGDNTSACQDAQDNDLDGAIDYPNDFSCSSPQDNDEGDVKAGCQDGTDNDGDGLIDGNDRGCTDSQDNSEGGETIACQDQIDNDGDGLIDLSDPGCTSKEDRSEENTSLPISLSLECVQDNRDATFTAYFSYESNLSTPQKILPSSHFSNNATDSSMPSELLFGKFRGVARTTFSSDFVRWEVDIAGQPHLSADASRGSMRCAPVTPTAQCIDSSGTESRGTFGYTNPNPFEIKIAAGPENRLIDITGTSQPPTVFRPGYSAAAFSTAFSKRALWILQGAPAELTNTSSVCAGGCIGTSTTGTRSEINAAAVKLASITTKAAQFMQDQLPHITSTTTRAILRADIRRAKTKALNFVKDADRLMISFPTISKSCPNAASVCTSVSRADTIAQLRSLIRQQEVATKRFISRALFLLKRKTSRTHSLIAEAKQTATEGLVALERMPVDVTTCG